MKKHRSYTTSLSALLRGICKVPAVLDTVVSGLSIDSRMVKKGDLFLALSGSRSQSTDHIKEAISKGANAVVAEGSLYQGKVFEELNTIELYVDDLKEKAGEIADRFFQSPSKDVCVIGVTGTNGKTSVSNYLASYLASSGKSCACIGTLGFGFVEKQDDFVVTGYTTPNVVETHSILAQLRDQGADVVVMEVSSHGLDQGRVESVRFRGAVYTNLSHEHLDYHGDMDSYASSKRRLFEVPGLEFAVINQDDQYAEVMASALGDHVRLVTFGLHNPADVNVLDKQLSASGMHALVNAPIGQIEINSNLVGSFNLSNLLAVVAAAIALNDANDLEHRLSEIKSVSGRMEVVSSVGKPTVIVDYAHTPDALKSVLEAIKPHCEGKLTVVFGCGGDRDKAKRGEMARIAERLSDKVVVTDDNPRNEDPEQIVLEIMKGFENQAGVIIEHDRRKAIAMAICDSTDRDVILVAGKGHETWQEICGVRTYFNDIEQTKEILGVELQAAKQREMA